MLRFLSRYCAAILVGVALGLALFLRIAVPYSQVFTETGVRFVEVDSYSHMRLVDNTLAHMPIRTPFDPYTYYPEGAPVYYPPLFTLFLSGAVWLFSLGAPTPASTDVIGALFPAVLGSLTVIPAFFLARAVFNKWAGVIAALLMAIMPGEALGRTMIGFTDHHVIEILFTTTAMMFLVMAGRDSARVSLRPFRWRSGRKPLLLAAAGGLFLGLYLQMWAGGPIFVLLLIVYFAVQAVVIHLRGEKAAGYVVVGVLAVLTASAVILPFLPRHYSRPLYFVGLGGAVSVPLVLHAVSTGFTKMRLPRWSYPVGLVALALLALGGLRLASPVLYDILTGGFYILSPSEVDLTIGEVEPLFFPGGDFSLKVMWLNFTFGFLFAVIMLGVMARQSLKEARPERTLLFVWSVAMLGLTLAQRRFAYYYAVNVAVLTAGLAWLILKRAGLQEILNGTVEGWRRSLRAPVAPAVRPRAVAGLALAGVILLVVAPDIPPAFETVSQTPFAPGAAWVETLDWLRENSPEPFGERDAYYEVVEKLGPGKNFAYPDSAYGVMAWWDYGHWITRIARRLPNHAPGGGRSVVVARALLAQDEETARSLTQQLDSLYVIADYRTAVYAFHGVASFAGGDRSEYFDVYYQEQGGQLKPVTLLYPEYYRSLLARLYFFEGRSVEPEKTTVITWEERRWPDGSIYRLVTDARQFTGYAEAETYARLQPGENLRIVGTDPYSSPIPLEALEHYRLVHRSSASDRPGRPDRPTPVKVFVFLEEAPVRAASGGSSGW